MEELKKLAAILETRGFTAHLAENKEEATAVAMSLISKDETVGVPGTMTVREMGLYGALKERGNKIFDHWESAEGITDTNANYLNELTADWVVTSTNAISADKGILINIDGRGNRVAAISLAPGKLMFVIGKNKIGKNFEEAMDRARNIASVKNAARFNIDTPCKTLGKCMICNSKDKICNVITFLEHASIGRETHIILINEELGF